MKRILTAASIIILTGGCATYTDYVRPEIETRGLYGAEYETEDPATPGSLAWRDMFADPHLQTLIQTGLENNTDLRVAYLRITQSQASVRAAKLAYLPSFALSPQYSLGAFDGGAVQKNYQLPLAASWEVDVFGKLTTIKKQELAALEQSAAYRQAVQSRLVADIANAYYTLLMLDRQLDISRQTLATWEENIRALQALKTAGQADQAAVAQAEADKLSVEASIADLQLQVCEMENTVCSLLAIPPQAIARGRLEEQDFPQTLAAGIPLQMLSNRPDVRQAEAALKQAFYYVNESIAHFYPSITLSGTFGWSNNGSGISNPAGLLWEAVGSLTQPLFSKGTNRARLAIARARQEEATLAFQQTLLDAGIEVNNTLAAWQTARRKTGIYESQLEQLESAVASTKLLMTHGAVNYLEVLTAQQSLLTAQLNQAANRFAEIQGAVNLYSALGGGQ